MADFQEHVGLLRLFLTHREEIVESIQTLLNASQKPAQYLQDRPLLSRHFEDCFFGQAAVAAAGVRLRGELEAAYWAGGFRPRELPGIQNDLIHPAEMTVRGFHFWHQTRWPGRKGRTHYAHTLFNVYVVRCFEFLSLHLWDENPGEAPRRLVEIQSVLDALWSSSPLDQPVIVRDARWLIPLAQSLPTDELAPYLEVARQVTATLSPADVLEIQKAHVRMLGGHLTSQIRHHCTRDGVPIDDPATVLRTRTSNALDFSLLIQGLVGLLHAYDSALQNGDERTRLDMAGAIFQGLSADPGLFLNHVDLLSAYTMIEHVFIDREGPAVYSSLGERHRQLVEEYATRINRLAKYLQEDLPRFQPVAGGYSPYGAVFGWPSTLTELIAFKAIERGTETRFSLEDVFDDRDTGAAKLAWVDGWRKMPHIPSEVQRLYDYPHQFAEDIYHRIERELKRRADAPKIGRLYIAGDETPEIPELPARYFASSDKFDTALLHERQEGHFLVSFQSPDGWLALKKDLLTEHLGAGRDARITGLPPQAIQVLRLMCTELLAAP